MAGHHWDVTWHAAAHWRVAIYERNVAVAKHAAGDSMGKWRPVAVIKLSHSDRVYRSDPVEIRNNSIWTLLMTKTGIISMSNYPGYGWNQWWFRSDEMLQWRGACAWAMAAVIKRQSNSAEPLECDVIENYETRTLLRINKRRAGAGNFHDIESIKRGFRSDSMPASKSSRHGAHTSPLSCRSFFSLPVLWRHLSQHHSPRLLR